MIVSENDDELDDFWTAVRPPALPRPSAAPQPAPVPIERGVVWFALIQDGDAFKGHVPARIRATIPEGNPMLFDLGAGPGNVEMTVVGVEMYDREVGGELLYTTILRAPVRVGPTDRLNLRLSLEDHTTGAMANLAGLRTGFRLRGLL